MRSLFAFGLLLANVPSAFAIIAQPTPGPIVGAVAGPWGLVVAGLGYGAYRAYKAMR